MPAMLTPGILLAGRYQLQGRIAAGAVGEVWRATDLVLSLPVAVKRLRDGYAGQAEAMARFRAEARHAGALSHPGIAQVYDYGEADPPSPPFLVMEFVDGPSLAGLLDGGPLAPGDAMDVLAQVAAGLAAAHAAGLVHRDIKPANLLVAPDGHVKITDFGIAHAACSAQLTGTGTMIGTPSYLAPERAAGASATPASDLYSLGVVGYECLAGQPPFQGTPMEVVAACQSAPVPPLPAAVPAAVAALVMELTAKDPAARPASASQVATRAARLRDTLRDSPAATLAAVPGPGPAGPPGGWPADPAGTARFPAGPGGPSGGHRHHRGATATRRAGHRLAAGPGPGRSWAGRAAPRLAVVGRPAGRRGRRAGRRDRLARAEQCSHPGRAAAGHGQQPGRPHGRGERGRAGGAAGPGGPAAAGPARPAPATRRRGHLPAAARYGAVRTAQRPGRGGRRGHRAGGAPARRETPRA